MMIRARLQRMQLDKATGAKCFTLSSSALQPPAYSTLVPVGSDFDYSKRGKRSDQAS
jgi:putative heme iron utilization protein